MSSSIKANEDPAGLNDRVKFLESLAVKIKILFWIFALFGISISGVAVWLWSVFSSIRQDVVFVTDDVIVLQNKLKKTDLEKPVRDAIDKVFPSLVSLDVGRSAPVNFENVATSNGIVVVILDSERYGAGDVGVKIFVSDEGSSQIKAAAYTTPNVPRDTITIPILRGHSWKVATDQPRGVEVFWYGSASKNDAQ